MGNDETPAVHSEVSTSEWELLRMAYELAVRLAQGVQIDAETLAKFRQVDEVSELMFSDWWTEHGIF